MFCQLIRPLCTTAEGAYQAAFKQGAIPQPTFAVEADSYLTRLFKEGLLPPRAAMFASVTAVRTKALIQLRLPKFESRTVEWQHAIPTHFGPSADAAHDMAMQNDGPDVPLEQIQATRYDLAPLPLVDTLWEDKPLALYALSEVVDASDEFLQLVGETVYWRDKVGHVQSKVIHPREWYTRLERAIPRAEMPIFLGL